MRAPAFWWRKERSAAAFALMPAGWIMGAIGAHRMARAGERVDAPVVCVGNFVAGGAGKTPTAMACARFLQAAGFNPAFLSRGYGGSASRGNTPLQVDPATHGAALTGDEPLLLARSAPTFVAADRAKSARAAISRGADVLVMDDGLQNPSLRKDFRIAVVDGETGIGNGLCLPAGPLRAPFDQQLNHVDAVVVIGAGEAGERAAGRAQARGMDVYRAELQNDPAAAAALAGQRVIAFAGIGRPEKFFQSLEAAGAIIMEAFSFDDHQPLSQANLAQLRQSARTHQAGLVTTEKDFVRMAGAHETHGIETLPVKLAIAAETAFARTMLAAVRAAQDR